MPNFNDKTPEPFGMFAALVQPSGYGPGVTFTRKRFYVPVEVSWEWKADGGNGGAEIWLDSKLLDDQDVDVEATALANEWEFLLEIRGVNDTEYSTWYRGVIVNVEKQFKGQKELTKVTCRGYADHYLHRIQVDNDYTAGTQDVKTLVGLILDNFVTAQSRIVHDATQIDASTYTPTSFDLHNTALHGIGRLLELQGSREWCVDPVTRKLTVKAVSTVVPARNVFVVGKDIEDMKDGTAQDQTVNTYVLVGHPRYGSPIVVTRADAAQVTADGKKVQEILLPELSSTADLNQWADNNLADWKIKQEWKNFKLTDVKDRIEGSALPVGKVRVWRQDRGESAVFLDLPLADMKYKFGRVSPVAILDPLNPTTLKREDYSFSSECRVGKPPLTLLEVIQKVHETQRSERQMLVRNVVTVNGITSVPADRLHCGIISVDCATGATHVRSSSAWHELSRTGIHNVWTYPEQEITNADQLGTDPKLILRNKAATADDANGHAWSIVSAKDGANRGVFQIWDYSNTVRQMQISKVVAGTPVYVGSMGNTTPTTGYTLTVERGVNVAAGVLRFPDGSTQKENVWEAAAGDANSAIFLRSGKVAIGTVTPSKKLTIKDTADDQMEVQYDGTNHVRFRTTSAGDLTITPTGDEVKISTATPKFTLEDTTASGDDYSITVATAKMTTKNETINIKSIEVTHPTTSSVDIRLGQQDTAAGRVRLSGAPTASDDGGSMYIDMGADHDTVDDHFYIEVNQDDLRVGTPSGEYMRFQNAGDVRLTPPSGTVHIQGQSPAKLKLTDPAAGDIWSLRNSAGLVSLYNETDALSRLAITGAGDVGVGTEVPTEKLSVSAGHILLDNTYALLGKNSVGSALNLIQRTSADVALVGDSAATFNELRLHGGSTGGFATVYAGGSEVGRFTSTTMTWVGVLSTAEQASAPGATSGYGKWYTKIDGATNKPYFQAEDGTEYNLSAGGVSDHGALTGLGDDDHTQYILVDGSRAFSAEAVFASSVRLAEIAAPGTPAAGYGRVYFKTDGKVYAKNDGGTEYDLTLAGTVTGTGVNTRIPFWTGSSSLGSASGFTYDDTVSPSLIVTTSVNAASNQTVKLIGNDRTTAIVGDTSSIGMFLERDNTAQVEFARVVWRADVITASYAGSLVCQAATAGALQTFLTVSGLSSNPAVTVHGYNHASGSPTIFKVSGVALSSLTAGTEAVDVDIALNRTVTFSTGALALQRATVFRAPTYAFVGASTLTDAATVAITGAPIESTNATIVNSHALLIQGGAATGATNAFGLTVNAPTGGTNNYSAQFLGGNVGIGTSAPAALLGVGSSNQFTVTSAGAVTGVSFTGSVIANTAGLALNVRNTTDAASVETVRLYGSNRATAALNDQSYISWYTDTPVGGDLELLRIRSVLDETTGSQEYASLRVQTRKNGSLGDAFEVRGARGSSDQRSVYVHGYAYFEENLSASGTDMYAAALRLDPDYTTAGTITRHNYIELRHPVVTGGGSITDACVFRFDFGPGTHKAVDAGTTKVSPGTVDGWLKMNYAGTVYYVPSYTSKTA